MKFYVIWSDGRKFGPADIATLTEWAKEGRITRDTQVENAETGLQGRARDIQGMQWPTAAPATDLGGSDPTLKAGEAPLKQQSSFVDIPGQPKPYVAGQPASQTPASGSAHDPLKPSSPQGQQPSASPYDPLKAQQPSGAYQNPPQPGGAQYNRHVDDGSQKLINNAWILYAVGFLCCCFCTPFGLYSANRAKIMGNPNAQTPYVFGWVLLILQVIGLGIYIAAFAMGAVGAFPGR
jgi:hypothetical protein